MSGVRLLEGISAEISKLRNEVAFVQAAIDRTYELNIASEELDPVFDHLSEARKEIERVIGEVSA